MKRLEALFLALFLLAGLAAWADTYDGHTLVAITVSDPGEVQVLYDSRADIVGRKGDVFKALLTDEQLCALSAAGMKIEVLQAEMDEDRRLWREADEASAANAPGAYYTASKFNTTSPPSGSLMEHLLQLCP